MFSQLWAWSVGAIAVPLASAPWQAWQLPGPVKILRPAVMLAGVIGGHAGRLLVTVVLAEAGTGETTRVVADSAARAREATVMAVSGGGGATDRVGDMVSAAAVGPHANSTTTATAAADTSG